MSEYMPAKLRRLIRERAGHRCEYCLFLDEGAFLPHEPDHIIAAKHPGETNGANLAWTCFICNRGKGGNLATVDETTGDIVRLFHPRSDSCDEHLELMKDRSLSTRTAIGRFAISLPKLNRLELLAIQVLIAKSIRKPR
jgi:hypothetical protein